jgi:hypothetical protein
MYELWLTLNIAYEQLSPYAIPIGIVLFVVFYRFLRILTYQNPNWRSAIFKSILVGIIVSVICFFIVPGAIRSGFANMGYWLDWLFLVQQAVSLGFFATVAAFAFFIKDEY